VLCLTDLLAESAEYFPANFGVFSLVSSDGTGHRAGFWAEEFVVAYPRDLAAISAAEFDAVVFPGRHGPMVDLAVDGALGALLNAADAAGTIITPFCHGPAAVLSTRRADGSFTFSGRRMTSSTDADEQAGGLAGMQWLLASRLREEGAIMEAGPAFSSFVVTDGNLITGQNPQSSQAVSDAVLAALHG